MRTSWAASVLALVRLRNLLLSAAGVAIGGALAQGHAVLPAVVRWAMASAMLLGAAGNVANDIADRDADRVNRPDRPLVSGTVSMNAALLIGGVAGGLGLWTALWVDRRLFLFALAALAVMLVYSPLLKRFGLAGNLAVAVVASLPLVYGALAVGLWRAGLVPAALAALLHFARELVKDVEDAPGDGADGRATVPLRWGAPRAMQAAAIALILFVPASLAPYFAGWYGWRYALVTAALDVGVLAVIARLLMRRPAGLRGALKAAMLVGLAALLWDRL
jgi:geranylgeranylglycerol-phosphate geranylgeranyltransferase